MTRPAISGRRCPLCDADVPRADVACPVACDKAEMDALRPYWFGIDQARTFFSYVRCGNCRALYNRVFFDDAQLAGLYAAMPQNMDLVADDAVAATQRGYYRAAATGDLVPGGYLEIGPDVGHLVTLAARGPFDRFWLFEPNVAVHPRLRAAAGGRDAFVSTDMTDLSAVPDGSVSLAVMVHVLDHLLNPRAMLRAVHAKLAPGGRLLLVTHNEGSLLRRALGWRWPPFCLQHPQLFNPHTMQWLLRSAYFHDIEVRPATNCFPIDFLVRQGLRSLGLPAPRVGLPGRNVNVRLGNILTLATRQAGTAAIRLASAS